MEFEGDVVGEHAQQGVGAYAVFEVVVDRADLDQVFHRAEGPLGHLQLLVGANDGGRARELRGRAGGADHVEAVERGLGVDLRVLALVGEGAVCDRELEVLGDLVAVDDAPDALADRARVRRAQRSARALDHRADALELGLGRREQLLALARALGGDGGVAADDEALAGELGGADLGQVGLVEERELQIAGLDERPDLGGLQRAEEVDPRPVSASAWAR